jgi:hypothetical protein
MILETIQMQLVLTKKNKTINQQNKYFNYLNRLLEPM